MKKNTFIQKNLFAFLASLTIILALSACSDDDDKKADPEKETVSHTLLKAKVSNDEKVKFEQQFAAQCVARELHNSTNKEADERRINQSCTCIATYLMKDLTAIEAEKFITEHENAQSLRIKYENAAYHCLQQKVPPQEPDFSHP